MRPGAVQAILPLRLPPETPQLRRFLPKFACLECQSADRELAARQRHPGTAALLRVEPPQWLRIRFGRLHRGLHRAPFPWRRAVMVSMARRIRAFHSFPAWLASIWAKTDSFGVPKDDGRFVMRGPGDLVHSAHSSANVRSDQAGRGFPRRIAVLFRSANITTAADRSLRTGLHLALITRAGESSSALSLMWPGIGLPQCRSRSNAQMLGWRHRPRERPLSKTDLLANPIEAVAQSPPGRRRAPRRPTTNLRSWTALRLGD